MIPILRGALFGAFVGFCMGGLTGAAFCWTIETNDRLPLVASIAAGGGLVIGAIVGGVERWWRGEVTRPDIATFIGGGFGLVIAIFVFCGGFGAVGGRLAIHVLAANVATDSSSASWAQQRARAFCG